MDGVCEVGTARCCSCMEHCAFHSCSTCQNACYSYVCPCHRFCSKPWHGLLCRFSYSLLVATVRDSFVIGAPFIVVTVVQLRMLASLCMMTALYLETAPTQPYQGMAGQVHYVACAEGWHSTSVTCCFACRTICRCLLLVEHVIRYGVAFAKGC